MKKILASILILILVSSMFCPVSFAEYPLSSNEQKYVGAWTMFANNGKGKTYVIVITFLDNLSVVQRSMIFTNGVLTSDNKASGEWSGFTDETIIFSLAGTDMAAMIKDNGYLYLYFFNDLSLCGIYSRCADMTSVLGW